MIKEFVIEYIQWQPYDNCDKDYRYHNDTKLSSSCFYNNDNHSYKDPTKYPDNGSNIRNNSSHYNDDKNNGNFKNIQSFSSTLVTPSQDLKKGRGKMRTRGV